MKTMLRVFLVCLALILCMMPALVACDSDSDTEDSSENVTNANDNGENVTNTNGNGENVNAIEGRKISSMPNLQRTKSATMYQVEETNGKETVTCSIVVYDADGTTVLASTTFPVKVNGEDAKFECFNKCLWYDDQVDVTILDHDGVKTTYTLTFTP